MNVLDKILEEIEERIKRLKEADNMCRVNAERNRNFESMKYFQSLMFATERAESIIGDIIRSHMDEAKDTNDGWIPVEERLPDKGTYVMCCFDDGAVDALWQNWKEDKSLLFYADINGEIRKAIAWQELPEPYKPKKDNSATEHIMSRFTKVE